MRRPPRVRRTAPAATVVLAIVIGVLSGPAAAAETPPWSWPSSGAHRIVRGFEAPPTPYAAGHRGIDIAAGTSTSVTAPADGVVTVAGRIVDRGVIVVDTGGGVLATLEPVTASVAVGDRVVRGQVVGVLATGGPEPPGVLHLGARIHGVYVSPLLLLGTARHAVLLPVG